MPEINAKQIVLIAVSMLSFVAGASANLTDLFGASTAKVIVSIATFANGMITASLAPFLSNTSVARDAGALDGVKLQIDRSASPQIAALAVDEAQINIAPAPGEERALVRKAEGTAVV